MIWVADDGTGDYASLSEALDSITDATSSKPYVIKIAPGEYTETAPVVLKTYVDVEGSGQNTTTINCACSSNDFDASSAVISAGAITAEIRHFTINNTGGSNNASFGVYTNGVVDGSFSMLHVTATATGSTNSYGVFNSSSSPTMNNVTATGTGGSNLNYGVGNFVSSSPTMTNVTATGSGGLFSYGVYSNSSSPTIRNSSITGGTNSIRNSGTSSAQVADTMLGGPVVAGGGVACVGVYDTDFVATDANCVTP